MYTSEYGVFVPQWVLEGVGGSAPTSYSLPMKPGIKPSLRSTLREPVDDERETTSKIWVLDLDVITTLCSK